MILAGISWSILLLSQPEESATRFKLSYSWQFSNILKWLSLRGEYIAAITYRSETEVEEYRYSFRLMY